MRYLYDDEYNIIKINYVYIFIVYMMLFLLRITNFNRVGIFLTVILSIVCFVTSVKCIKINSILLSFFILTITNLLISLYHSNPKDIYYIILQLFTFFSILVYSNLSIKKVYLNKLIKLFSNVYIIFSIFFFLNLFMGNINYKDGLVFLFGIYHPIYIISYFLLLKYGINIKNIIICCSIHFFAGDRSLAISIICVYLVYKLISIFRNNEVLYKSLFWIVNLSLAVYPFIYVFLYKTSFGIFLNELFNKYTSQNFFSGRQIIWDITNRFIYESPFIGYGLGNDILSNNGINLSTHSTYIYILLSGGIIYFFTYSIFMYSIWKYFFLRLENKVVRLSASYFIGGMIYSANDLTIVSNDINFSLYFWFIVGIGIMVVNSLKYGIYE